MLFSRRRRPKEKPQPKPGFLLGEFSKNGEAREDLVSRRALDGAVVGVDVETGLALACVLVIDAEVDKACAVLCYFQVVLHVLFSVWGESCPLSLDDAGGPKEKPSDRSQRVES